MAPVRKWHQYAQRMSDGRPWVPAQVAEQLHQQLDNLVAAVKKREGDEEVMSREIRTRAARESQLRNELSEAIRERDLLAEQLFAARNPRKPDPEPAPVPKGLASLAVPSGTTGEGADDRVVRLAADLANVRRHTTLKIERATHEERVKRLAELASVYDDLLRGQQANQDPENPYFQGNATIIRRMEGMLDRVGATKVGQVGEEFDPSIHEALGAVPGPENQVMAVEQVGFRLDGGLVRPAKVLIGRA